MPTVNNTIPRGKERAVDVLGAPGSREEEGKEYLSEWVVVSHYGYKISTHGICACQPKVGTILIPSSFQLDYRRSI